MELSGNSVLFHLLSKTVFNYSNMYKYWSSRVDLTIDVSSEQFGGVSPQIIQANMNQGR